MDNRKQNIAVFGIGAIGSVMAYALQKSQAPLYIRYYNRSPRNGIKILFESNRYEESISLQVPPFSGSDLDWLIVCLKEHQYKNAVAVLSTLVSPKTKIAVIRNGLRLKEPFLAFVKENNILECSIDCSTQANTEGFYKIFKKPVLTLPEGLLADQFFELFQNTETEIRRVTDFKTESWKKVCESAALGSILCLSGETCWVFESEALRCLYLAILEESLKVARADGALIESDFKDKMLLKLLSYPKNKGSSMLTDRLNGNPIELGAKSNLIKEVAKTYTIETPLHNMVVALLEKTNTKVVPDDF